MNETYDELVLRVRDGMYNYCVEKYSDEWWNEYARRLKAEIEKGAEPDNIFRNLNFIVQYRRKDHFHSWCSMLAFDVEDLALREKRDCEGASRPWEYRLINRDGSVIEAPRSEDELKNIPPTPPADTQDAKRYRFIRPHLHIDSQGDLCLERNAMYIGPRDGIAKITTRMDAAIDAAMEGKK